MPALSFGAQLAVSASGTFFKTLAGMLQGKTDLEELREDQIRQLIQIASETQQNKGILRGQIDQEIAGINPEGDIDNLSQMLQGFLTKSLGQQSKRLGLDSGLAQKAAFGGYRTQLAQLLNQSRQTAQTTRTSLLRTKSGLV